MPLYYFDVHDGTHITDKVGVELEDFEAAKLHAMHVAAIHSVNPKMIGSNGGAMVIVIRRRDNTVMASVRMSFNINVEKRET